MSGPRRRAASKGGPAGRPQATWGLAPLLWLPGAAWADERGYLRVAAHRAIAYAVPSVRTL